jgi:hypothetical protein
MREGTDQRLLTATGMESWVEMNNLVFCSGYNVSTLLLKSTKEVFSMQELGTLITCYSLWTTVRLSIL